MAWRFGLVQKQNKCQIPLESIDIQVDIQGFTAHVVASMKYRNNEESPIEAIYIFPLDEDAAVCGFQAIINGRTIVAEVQDKKEAQDTYDDAVSSGQSAFLLEERNESSDIFQISVGNLPPKREALVELRFVTELSVESEGRVVFVLPTVLNPRYSPILTTQIPRVFTVDSPYSFTFEMKVKAISAITEISSTSNTLKVEVDGINKAQATVSLAEPHNLKQDIVVHILAQEPFKPQAIVENGIKVEGREDKQGFMANPVVMLNFFPEFKSPKSSKVGEFVFLMDRSSSMEGSRMDGAKTTLLLFLKSLPDRCYFNVVGFGRRFENLFEKSKPYNDKNLKKATDLTQRMRADLGSTEILEPLQWLFSQPAVKGHPRQVFLLSDGMVDNTKKVIQLVRNQSGTTRCFTFGIGSGVSHALIKGVARAGKGTAEFVSDHDHHLQRKVIRTLKRSLQPVMSDVSLTWDLPEGWTLQQIPSSLPPLFSGERLVVYGLMKPSKTAIQGGQTVVRLQGTLPKGTKVEHAIKFPTPTAATTTGTVFDPNSSAILHGLAAKSLIQDKQDELSEKSGVELEEGQSAIVSVSKSANVVSKYTSIVAVDKENHEPVSGPLRKRMVPLAYSKLLWESLFEDSDSSTESMESMETVETKKGSFFSEDLYKEDPGELCFADFNPLPMMATRETFERKCATLPAGLCEDSSSTLTKSSGSLFLSLISLQQASGAWDLTDELLALCKVSKYAVITGCPKEIAVHTSKGKRLWATALALVLLRGQFLDREDEWEMIARKGQKWMKKNLPAALNCESLLQSASIVIDV
ncbi:von Willebrand factor A domain-containing protein 5A-like [Acropora millepora]|uniref:von Willebrand factor A domain-containing protein 5A-like n=1 Tax=Acropora millepora TaxID=45264 RepID=UPI001CF4B2FD|nr:von Willebrand factor A domain-containing protein 5A-like [Acropora millepora]